MVSACFCAEAPDRIPPRRAIKFLTNALLHGNKYFYIPLIFQEGAPVMKKTFFAFFMVALFTATSVTANPQIQAKHKGLKKDGKMINCTYCHTTAKIEKKKGYNINNANKNALCMGSGCHPVKK